MRNDNYHSNETELIDSLKCIGLQIDPHSGHLAYHPHFKPIQTSTEIIIIRHGETYGNCGQVTTNAQIDHDLVRLSIRDKCKRIFQGYVDTEVNQLTGHGRQQAISLAEKLQKQFLEKGWIPDQILYSPLKRSFETALPFIEQNKLDQFHQVEEQIKEISFGAWDNRRLCDLAEDNICHSFYRDQNALVKESGINGNGSYQESENFCELLLRAYQFFISLENKYASKRIILFSHSMFGAAALILFGKGQTVEGNDYLAFDGKRSDNSDYTMPHTTPYKLTF